jgi:predicted nucleic-acid-binding Zn-ribbon protein
MMALGIQTGSNKGLVIMKCFNCGYPLFLPAQLVHLALPRNPEVYFITGLLGGAYISRSRMLICPECGAHNKESTAAVPAGEIVQDDKTPEQAFWELTKKGKES